MLPERKIFIKFRLQQLADKHKRESSGQRSHYSCRTFNSIADYVCKAAQISGDLVLTMGAGDIYKVGEMILEN